MTTDSELQARIDIVAFGRSLFDRGLASGSTGNISVRLPDGTVLITPTRASLGRLAASDIARVPEPDEQPAGSQPSKELFLHQAIYAARPQSRAVVHLHSTASAAISCLEGLNLADSLPPLTPYFVMKIGRLPVIPYHRPGAPELAEQIIDIARTHPAVLLANHGPIVAGNTLAEAVDRVEELEETAKLYLLLRDQRTRVLSVEEIAELKDVFGDALARKN